MPGRRLDRRVPSSSRPVTGLRGSGPRLEEARLFVFQVTTAHGMFLGRAWVLLSRICEGSLTWLDFAMDGEGASIPSSPNYERTCTVDQPREQRAVGMGSGKKDDEVPMGGDHREQEPKTHPVAREATRMGRAAA